MTRWGGGREDTAKYLRNLDPKSAYYDPKTRSMSHTHTHTLVRRRVVGPVAAAPTRCAGPTSDRA